eukprot:5746676-Pleurochrysis_carterae.AAC.2
MQPLHRRLRRRHAQGEPVELPLLLEVRGPSETPHGAAVHRVGEIPDCAPRPCRDLLLHDSTVGI